SSAGLATGEKPAPYGWILSPAIDLLFSCGGLVWLFFGLHHFIVGSHSRDFVAQALVVIVILATHLLSETHNIATLQRIYQDEDKTKFAYFKTKLVAICGTLAILGLAFPPLAAIFTKVYLVWVSQHFTAQTYGLA